MQTRSLTVSLAAILLFNQAGRAQTITSLAPGRNAIAAPSSATLHATFSQSLPTGTSLSWSVLSSQAGGRKAGIVSVNGNRASFTPTHAFKAGETLMASVRYGIATKQVWQFTTAATGGNGIFTSGSVVPVPTYSRTQDYLTVADMDGDQDLDILVPYYAGQSALGLLRNNGTGTLSTLLDLNISTRRFVTGDVDGDADLDIVYALDNGGLGTTLNQGGGSFAPASGIATATISALALGDVDADGDVDLVFAEESAKILKIYLNNGSGVFSGSTQVSLSSFAQRIELADIDSDGDLDVLTGCGDTDTCPLNIRLNNGNGLFSGTLSVPAGGYRGTIGVLDFDGDGDLDLAVPLFQPNGKLSLWRNSGNGTFVKAPDLYVGHAPQVLIIGDVDGDQDLDIISDARTDNTTSANINLNLNDGRGAFTRQSSIPITPFSVDLALADMDGDGDLDVVVYALSGSSTIPNGTVSVYHNASIPVLSGAGSAFLSPNSQISAWPNPVECGTNLHIELPVWYADSQAVLYNSLGVPIRTSLLPARTSVLQTVGLSPGIYLLAVTTNGRPAVTRRIVLQ